MTGGASKIDEPAFGQKKDFVTIRKSVLVDLRFDIGALHIFGGIEGIDLNFIVEVTDVSHDGLVFHARHVTKGDDIDIAGGGHVNIAPSQGLFDGSDLVTFHGRLQSIDWIDLGDDDARSLTTE